MSTPGTQLATRTLCTFKLTPYNFAVEVLAVQEILRRQEVTPVPLAPKDVIGLINLRGQLVTAIDLRSRLGMPPRAEGKEPIHLVVKFSEAVVSLVVDEVGDVVDVEEDRFEDRPDAVHGPAKELTTGVFRMEKDLLLLLDLRKAVGSRHGLKAISQ